MKLLIVILMASVSLAFPISDTLTTDPGAPSEQDLIAADVIAPANPSPLQSRMDKGFKKMQKFLGMQEPPPPPPPPPPQIVVMYPAYPIKPQYNYNYNSGSSYGGGGSSYGGAGIQQGPNFPFNAISGGPGGIGSIGALGPAGVGGLGPNSLGMGGLLG